MVYLHTFKPKNQPNLGKYTSQMKPMGLMILGPSWASCLCIKFRAPRIFPIAAPYLYIHIYIICVQISLYTHN